MNEAALCNITMAYLKVERIRSLDDKSEQAILCKEYLQGCIDDCLTDFHQFSCSKEYVSLEAPLSTTYRDYDYLYALPEDFLQPIEMVDLDNGDWEMTSAGIATSQNPLEMIYVKSITSVETLPSQLAKAVAYRLALEIGPLISPSTAQDYQVAVGMYNSYMKEAANRDGRMEKLSTQGEYTLLEDS